MTVTDWATATEADEMVVIAHRNGIVRETITRAMVDALQDAVAHLPGNDAITRDVIQAADRWARGVGPIGDVVAPTIAAAANAGPGAVGALRRAAAFVGYYAQAVASDDDSSAVHALAVIDAIAVAEAVTDGDPPARGRSLARAANKIRARIPTDPRPGGGPAAPTRGKP